MRASPWPHGGSDKQQEPNGALDGSRDLTLLTGFLHWVVAGIVWLAVQQRWTFALDSKLLLGIAGSLRDAGWVPVLLAASFVGSYAVRLPLAGLCVIVLVWRRDWTAIWAVTITAIGMLLANTLLKLAAGRLRPELLPQLATEVSLSFPSGHAANGAAVFGVLGWAAVRSGAPAPLVWPAVIVIVGLIGLSRIGLGVHWPSDVVAGWCVGIGWVLVCISATSKIRGRG